MTYIFEERIFKNHLRNNARKDWFSQSSSNARYRNKSGIHDLSSYSDRHMIRISNLLVDPECNKTGEKVGTAITATTGAVSGFLAAALSVSAPPAAVCFLAHSIISGGGATLVGSFINDPENVRFTISGDGSEWLIEEVPVGGIRKKAINICDWSNQIWEEKFENHAYQEQNTSKW